MATTMPTPSPLVLVATTTTAAFTYLPFLLAICWLPLWSRRLYWSSRHKWGRRNAVDKYMRSTGTGTNVVCGVTYVSVLHGCRSPWMMRHSRRRRRDNRLQCDHRVPCVRSGQSPIVGKKRRRTTDLFHLRMGGIFRFRMTLRSFGRPFGLASFRIFVQSIALFSMTATTTTAAVVCWNRRIVLAIITLNHTTC